MYPICTYKKGYKEICKVWCKRFQGVRCLLWGRQYYDWIELIEKLDWEETKIVYFDKYGFIPILASVWDFGEEEEEDYKIRERTKTELIE